MRDPESLYGNTSQGIIQDIILADLMSRMRVNIDQRDDDSEGPVQVTGLPLGILQLLAMGRGM